MTDLANLLKSLSHVWYKRGLSGRWQLPTEWKIINWNGRIVSDCFCIVKYFLAAHKGQMTLAEFVRRRMKEKNLSRLDIERNSGKAVTDSHVATILAGKAHNPTLKVLLGLAKALEVHPIEVFKAAAGVEDPEASWTAEDLIRANNKMLHLKPAEIKQVKKILKIE